MRHFHSEKVLVLDGHSRVAVEVVQSLGARGIAVDIAAEDEAFVAFRSRYLGRIFRQPPDVTKLADWLNETERLSQYSLVIPATENTLQAFRLLGGSSKPWFKALLPSQRSLETALNKQDTWSLAVAVGIPVPESRLIKQGEPYRSDAHFPSVLKPLQSVVTAGDRTISFEPIIVRDETERSRNLARLLPATSVQEQEYVGGRGVGVECLYAHGHMVWHFVHERVHELPLTGGGSTYRRSAFPEASIISAAKRLLDTLQWHGVAMVEFKRADDGDFRLMEINPCLWGSLALAIDAGVDFPWGMWLIANRHPTGPQPRYRVPYYSRYLPGDVDWMKENIRADHADPLLMTRPVGRSILEYLRPLVGKESWDHFRWCDPGIVVRQIRQVVTDNLTNIVKLFERHRLGMKIRRQHARLERELKQKGGVSGNLLFVCYGNICRSPFAGLYAAARLPGMQVRSAGFHQEEGRSSPVHLASAAMELGVDLGEHRSRRLDAKMIEQADLVVVMDLMNFESLVREYPSAVSKTMCLGLFAEGSPLEIEDPYLFSTEQTAIVLQQIMSGVDGLVRLSMEHVRRLPQ